MKTEDTTPNVADLQAKITLLEAENANLKTEIERLLHEVESNKAQSPEGLKELAARAQADLQNAKDRMEREKKDIRQYALEGTIVKLLPTIDNLQRAFNHLPDELASNDWVKGVESVERELMTMLREAGLHKIEAVGQLVNTDQHEVLQAVPGAADTVMAELEAGYTLHGKVLRPAKVQVGNGE